MHRHAETLVNPERLGRRIQPYRPTYEFHGFIDEAHRSLGSSPPEHGALLRIRNRPLRASAALLKDLVLLRESPRALLTFVRNVRRFGWECLPGWLWREDALKLYELAHFAGGDLLEIGCYHGLSTLVLARASAHAPRRKQLTSVDRNPACLRAAARNLRLQGHAGASEFLLGDGGEAVERFDRDGRRFAFVFVDHSHTYEDVLRVCRGLPRIVEPGGFVLFHDFNDTRNMDDADEAYGVYQAARDGLAADAFDFWGVYGCSGLYRRR